MVVTQHSQIYAYIVLPVNWRFEVAPILQVFKQKQQNNYLKSKKQTNKPKKKNPAKRQLRLQNNYLS